jgi:hypothetical protein
VGFEDSSFNIAGDVMEVVLPLSPDTTTPHTVYKTLWGARMSESSDTLLGAVRTFTDEL